MNLDLFAGPGGWDEGMALLGRTDVVGLEWDAAACKTAKAAGHARIRCDVTTYPTEPFAGIEGLIASPPCQAWSMAGKRKGELDRANCHALADRMAGGDDSIDWTAWEDDKSPLVCQPVRWVRDLRPEWVALEEVPAVASLWEHFARIFRGWGYSVWTGDLCAADYGVPQTRTRRILMASRTMTVQPPEPTHSEHPQGADLFGGQLAGWVSMATALGWGFDQEPSCTVTGGGTAAGGAEPFGNARYRARLTAFVSAGVTGEGRPKDPLTQPADTLTGRGTAYWMGDVRSKNGCVRPITEPSPTLTSSMDNGNFQWIRMGNAEHASVRHVTEPAPTVMFSHRANAVDWWDAPPTPAKRGTRVTVTEAGILQSFPADYPWAGSSTKRYEQVGNAIPPRLAMHVLAALGVGTRAALENTNPFTPKETT